MRMIAAVLACLFFAMQLFVSAQSNSANQSSQAQAGQSGQSTEGELALPETRQKLGGNDPQQRISREALHELLMLPYYSVFDNLAFKVNGDTETLMGQVVRPTLKSDAESAVKNIEGVEKVNNEIEVLPPSNMDDRIRRAVYHSIYGFGGLSRYSWGAVPSIHIIVNRGHVTLVGQVDNETDKNMAGIRAKTVPGTFSVTNNLTVGGSQNKKEAKVK